MSSAEAMFSRTAMGLPESSRIRDSWDRARFSSLWGWIMSGISELPQNFLGSLRLGKMTKGIKP